MNDHIHTFRFTLNDTNSDESRIISALDAKPNKSRYIKMLILNDLNKDNKNDQLLEALRDDIKNSITYELQQIIPAEIKKYLQETKANTSENNDTKQTSKTLDISDIFW